MSRASKNVLEIGQYLAKTCIKNKSLLFRFTLDFFPCFIVTKDFNIF